MQGKIVIRYEMTDEQQAQWAAGHLRGAAMPMTGQIVDSVRRHIEGLLAESPFAACATIQVSFQ